MKKTGLKSLTITLAIATIAAAGTIAYLTHKAAYATVHSAVSEHLGETVKTAAQAKAAYKEMAISAFTDISFRQERLQDLETAQAAGGLQQIAGTFRSYFRYGPVSQAEAVQFEREQLAEAQTVVQRYQDAEKSWTAVANHRATLAQN